MMLTISHEDHFQPMEHGHETDTDIAALVIIEKLNKLNVITSVGVSVHRHGHTFFSEVSML